MRPVLDRRNAAVEQDSGLSDSTYTDGTQKTGIRTGPYGSFPH